jgi:hypothetical protein
VSPGNETHPRPPYLGRGLLALLLAALAVLSTTVLVDMLGRESTDEGIKRAVVAFGVARALNGAISVLQGTELAVKPVGVGITLTPGQILDPVNDLVEQFSWVMLAASVSFGIQKLLLTVGGWTAFTWLVAGVLAAAVLALVWPGRARPWRAWLVKLAVLLAVLRFAAPGMALLSEGVFHTFLAPQYEEATAQLQQTTARVTELGDARAEPAPAGEGLLGAVGRLWDGAVQTLDIDARLERYQAVVGNASQQAIDLTVVFVVQTAVLPLVFLLLLYALARSVWRAPLRAWLNGEPSA